MAVSKDRIINEALDVTGKRGDPSLRAQSLRRALAQRPPRTMTAWEWEEWYAQHGVPATHRRATSQKPDTAGWWSRLLAGFAKGGDTGQ